MRSLALRRLSVAFAFALLPSFAFAQGALAQGSPQAQRPAAAAVPAYANETLADQAVRLEGALRGTVKLGNRKAADWSKLGTGFLDKGENVRAAEAFAAAAVAAPRDPKNWVALAAAWIDSLPDDSTKKAEQRLRAGAAAYIAYQRATAADDKAAALALVGETFADAEEWRPALNAYRASLALADDDEVRSTYEELRDEHGFRILRNSVDADAASPRLCVQFSEQLSLGSRDPSAFVSVRDNPPGLTVAAEGDQLCVDGVRHGERYNFTIRAGVPALVGESLEKPAEFSVFIRDRNPMARFTGRNYALPRTGQRGIPVVTVNTDAVAVDVYRVGDRALASTIVDENFQRQLDKYEIQTLETQTGAKIWSGELAVGRERNKEVTTAFPVDSTIGALQPGVYVMVAQPKSTAAKSEDDWEARATQWFIVSDLGLTALMGDDGLVVMLRSLASAQPVAGAKLSLVAKNNEILASLESDANGFVRVPAGMVRGSGGSAPALLTAETADKDYAFLDLTQPGFDFTDRGVAGRDAPGPIDAFVYTERGVYRPGETVFATVLARNERADALSATPLTLLFERPDGVEYRRMLVGDQGLGGRSVALPISSSAMTGTWRLRVLADPKRPPVGETRFLVEDFVPDRIEVSAETRAPAFVRTGTTDVDVGSRFLYGAPASGLAVSGDVVVSVASEAPGVLKGYKVGVPDDEITATRGELPAATLDNEGKAVIAVEAPELPDTDQPLTAQVTVRVTEGGGRGVSRSVTLPVARSGPVIGIKPLFDGEVPDGQSARFDVIAVGPDGAMLDRKGLTWNLMKVETQFQWYSEGGRWRFNRYETMSRVADGRIDVGANGPVRVDVPVTYGRYRLDVAGSDAPLTRVAFDAGWYSVASTDTPDQLRLVLDKPSYAVGDTATVTLEPRFPGRATVMVVNDQVYSTREVDVGTAATTVSIPVDAAWGPGAYVVAFLHRPLDVAAGRMPGRAIGLSWLALDKGPRTIGVALTAPPEMQPPGTLSVPLTLTNLAAGEEAYLTVSAVDVGILNLTRYKAPAPEDRLYAQRKLGMEVRDLYGQLIDGMRANAGAVRSGGDGGEDGMEGSPPAEAPLALFSGIVKAGADGKATVSFDIPPFNGTMRLMAVAWSRDKVGHAETDVLVRDPVVMTATLPRFLASGDRSTFRLDVDNVTGPAGSYTLQVGDTGPAGTGLLHGVQRKLDLSTGQRVAVDLDISAGGVGTAQIVATLTGPDGKAYARTYTLGVRPSLPSISRRTVTPLVAKTGSVRISPDLLADFVPGSGSVAVTVTPSTAIDVPALLGALDRYPYGCSEQVTSRAMPLLYVNELAARAALPVDLAVDQRIRDSIERVLSRQNADGSFGMWGVGEGDFWIDSYVTDFLTRAREKGFEVPDVALTSALDNLRNSLSYKIDELDDQDGSEIAYALYVLARNGRAPLGDLRYLAEEKIDEFTTALGRAQLGAALALLGDTPRATAAFAKAREIFDDGEADDTRSDYGSILRDRAAVLTLVSESRIDQNTMPSMLSGLATARGKRRHLSTQENAWLVLAAQALTEAEKRMQLRVFGTPHQGRFQQTFTESQIGTSGLSIANVGNERLSAIVTATGSPKVPEPAASEGFTLERKFYNLDGTELVPEKVKQTSRFVVVLTVGEAKPAWGQVMVVDRLPAGFEIDNPNLIDGATLKAFAWLPQGEDAETPDHTEFRDDRFVAAFSRSEESKASFSAAYMVRAVSPGSYVLPPATVEDMYRPERFARTNAGRVEVTK